MSKPIKLINGKLYDIDGNSVPFKCGDAEQIALLRVGRRLLEQVESSGISATAEQLNIRPKDYPYSNSRIWIDCVCGTTISKYSREYYWDEDSEDEEDDLSSYFWERMEEEELICKTCSRIYEIDGEESAVLIGKRF